MYELSRTNSKLHPVGPTMASTPFPKVTLLQEIQAEVVVNIFYIYAFLNVSVFKQTSNRPFHCI